MRLIAGHIVRIVPWWLAVLCYAAFAAIVVPLKEGMDDIFLAVSLAIPVVYLLLYKKKWLLYALFFCIPLSVSRTVGGGTALVFPSEIICGMLAFVVLLIIVIRTGKPGEFLRHPVSILLLVETGWMLVACLLSKNPDVSFKRLAVRVCYIVVFYFLTGELGKEIKNIPVLFWLYAVGMIVPIVRSLQFHARFDFSTTAAYMMTLPYYKDHTIYGAALAFVTVTLGFFLLHRKMFVRRDAFVLPAWLLLAFLAIALFFSYSRAAWLSVLAAVALYVFMRFRISLSTILLLICLTGFGIYIKRFDILKRLEQTEAESNKGDVTNHIQSVTNLQTDASNKERVNRWICAYRMFLERPVSGFGPGTYQFHYGRFQVRSYMTRISTFSGNKGHAHSEYFGALAETGLPGFVILLAVFITVVRTGMKTAYSAATPYIRYATIACLLGVVTYYVHGLFNGFMDTDKIAALVFAGTAAIVRLNIANRKLYTGKISPDERPAD